MIYDPKIGPTIEGVSEELKRKTIKRIHETLKQNNGIICNNCKVALISIIKNKSNIPFYCNICVNCYGIQGSYGISEFLNQEDKWLPDAHNKNDIRITIEK